MLTDTVVLALCCSETPLTVWSWEEIKFTVWSATSYFSASASYRFCEKLLSASRVGGKGVSTDTLLPSAEAYSDEVMKLSGSFNIFWHTSVLKKT